MMGVNVANALIVLLAAGEGWALNVKPATRTFTTWQHRLGTSPYYVGPTLKFSNGDKHVHGARVRVLGRQTCNNNAASYHCKKRLIVRFPHNDLSSAILENELSMHKPSSKKNVHTHKAVVPTKKAKAANFLQLLATPKTWMARLGTNPYFIGKTQEFSNGDKHVHGEQVRVLGRQTCKNNVASYHCDKRLIVRFPGNDLTSALLEDELSKHRPTDTHGHAYKALASRKTRKHVTLLEEAEDKPTANPWRARFGTNPYYIGKPENFSNGDKHVYGEQVTVLGRQTCGNNIAEYHCEKRLIVRFPGNELTSALLEDDLSKDFPAVSSKA